MTQKLHKKLEESLESPDNSWNRKEPTLEQYIQQMEAIQGPEDWERLVSIQCDHEGMNQLLFTPEGDVRHINGYTQGK